MQIEIVRPIFKCAEDEAIFVSRLRELPGYKCATDDGQYVYLQLTVAPDAEVTERLMDICTTWNATFKPVSGTDSKLR